jgi:hypothetical protein
LRILATKAPDDWLKLAEYEKVLMATTLINLYHISTSKLLGVIISQATNENLGNLMKKWKIETKKITKKSEVPY